MKTLFHLCYLCLFLILFLFATNKVNATTSIKDTSMSVTLSVSIGEPKLTLFGYTSSNALVELDGQRVSEQVIANNSGYFFFDRVFLPRPHRSPKGEGGPAYPELCLTSVDTQSRISFPTCLPPLPTGPYEITVGPVLLPPTLSLSKGYFLPKELINAQGLTIPNTEVNIFLANDHSPRRSSLQDKPFGHLRGGTVHAYSLPQYQIKADAQGRFSFNLPTAKSTNWRLFASSQFQGSPSPKSNTLNFKILNWVEWLWLMITNVFGAFLRLTKPYLWLAVILSEIIIAAWLLIKRKTPLRHSE